MITNGRSFDLQGVPLATVADGAVQGFADGLLAARRVVGGDGRPSIDTIVPGLLALQSRVA